MKTIQIAKEEATRLRRELIDIDKEIIALTVTINLLYKVATIDSDKAISEVQKLRADASQKYHASDKELTAWEKWAKKFGLVI